MFDCVVGDTTLHHPFSPPSGSVITAQQVLGHPLLQGQNPASNKDHGALIAIEVVSYDHCDSFRTTHGGVHPLQVGQWTLIGCNTRCGWQIHIIYVFFWDGGKGGNRKENMGLSQYTFNKLPKHFIKKRFKSESCLKLRLEYDAV